MMTTARRLNKKQQYINGLVFDRDHLQTDLARMIEQKQFFTWWHGEVITRVRVKQYLDEIREELERIDQDATYQPWKE